MSHLLTDSLDNGACMKRRVSTRLRGRGSTRLRWWRAFARHYVRDIVYAANDGVVTTFAVVAGVRGAGLSSLVILALGCANLAADGISMAAGDYLGIKSERMTRRANYDGRAESLHALKHGAVTWLVFVIAGSVPLLPFLVGSAISVSFVASLVATGTTLFVAGALRCLITPVAWWRAGLEMLLIGSIAGAASFFVGWWIRSLIGVA